MSDLENLDNPAADTESQSGKGSSTSTKPSLLDLLNAKDDNEDKNSDESDESNDLGDSSGTDDEKEDKETEEKEEDEEVEEEIEEKDETEEEETEELKATFSGLKKKYPAIFKDFPSLRTKIGREIAFSELYPTLDDARNANQKAEVFDIYEAEIQKGNPEAIIGALPNINSATKFAEQILPALHKANPRLFDAAVGPVINLMLNKISKDAESANDKNLGLAARYVARYLTGKDEIPAIPTRNVNQTDPEKEELRNRLNQAEQRQYGNFESSVTNAVSRTLSKEASALLDPKDTLAPKLKEVLINQIINEVDQELSSNANHMAKMKAFREKAFKSGLDDGSKTRILSSYLAAARPVLRTVSQRIKTETLGKKSGSVNSETTPEKQDKGRKVIPSSSGSSRTTQPSTSSKLVSKQDIKQFKAKGGQMEDILGG